MVVGLSRGDWDASDDFFFFQDLLLKVCHEILLGKEETPQNSHMFPLFDFPQNGLV